MLIFSQNLRKESLEEILNEARRQIRDDEWRALFRENYQGGAVLFDDQLVENDQGQIELQWYSAQIGKVKARIEIPLKVLTKVDLGQPRRVIFGARLHSIQRGEGGVWIIRFDPDSGVLITEPELLRFVSGQPLDDETLRQVSEQRRWLNLSKEQP